MSLVALRSRRREAVGGMTAAAIVAVPVVLIAMALPWIVDAVKPVDVGSGVLLGLWAHAIVIPPALALGALSSRVIAGTPGRAAAILAGGIVLALVLGMRSSPIPWLAPPLISTAHTLAQGARGAPLLGLTTWALLWSAVVLTGYGWLRRTRS
jgi:chromate transport protein ChrA